MYKPLIFCDYSEIQMQLYKFWKSRRNLQKAWPWTGPVYYSNESITQKIQLFEVESLCSSVCFQDCFFFLFFFNEQAFLLTKQLCSHGLNPRIFFHDWMSLLLFLNVSFPWPCVLHSLLQSSLAVGNLCSRWIVGAWCLGVEAFECQGTRKTGLACQELTYERLKMHCLPFLSLEMLLNQSSHDFLLR